MKKIIIVCGLPGAGKSTIAEGIAKKLNITLLSVDPIESAIIKAGVPRNFATGLAAYLVVETIAVENLQQGNPIIIDAVSGVSEAKQMWRNLAQKFNTELIIIECICSDEETYQQRIANRVRRIHGISEVTWADVLKRKAEYTAWAEPLLVIDSLDSIKSNLAKALDYIATKQA